MRRSTSTSGRTSRTSSWTFGHLAGSLVLVARGQLRAAHGLNGELHRQLVVGEDRDLREIRLQQLAHEAADFRRGEDHRTLALGDHRLERARDRGDDLAADTWLQG